MVFQTLQTRQIIIFFKIFWKLLATILNTDSKITFIEYFNVPFLMRIYEIYTIWIEKNWICSPKEKQQVKTMEKGCFWLSKDYMCLHLCERMYHCLQYKDFKRMFISHAFDFVRKNKKVFDGSIKVTWWRLNIIFQNVLYKAKSSIDEECIHFIIIWSLGNETPRAKQMELYSLKDPSFGNIVSSKQIDDV